MGTEWIYAPMWHITCIECEQTFKLENSLISQNISGSGYFLATCPHCNNERYYNISTNRVWLQKALAEEFEFQD